MQSGETEHREAIRSLFRDMIARRLLELEREQAARGFTVPRPQLLDRVECELPVRLPQVQAELHWPKEQSESIAEIAFEALMDIRRKAV